jgi:toxin HigB-1
MAIIYFRDDETETLFKTGHSRKFSSIGKVAKRKLDAVNAAVALNDLQVPPGNRLETLKGDREGQHSIRVNDQYRACFRWTERRQGCGDHR